MLPSEPQLAPAVSLLYETDEAFFPPTHLNVMALFVDEKGTFVFRILVGGIFFALFSSESHGQQPPVDPDQPVAQSAEKNNQPPTESKRLLGIIPNYRTSPSLQNYEPLTSEEKFKIASQDAFDRGTIGLAVLYGGESQLTNSNRAFGRGGAGFGRYLGAAYGDFVIGDYMTEAVFPIMLHQDPRYFRRGTGTGWSRLGYSMSQIFWTHRDSGGTQFNYSEVIGNATAVAISNAYYVDNRDASDAVSKLGMQIGIDMAANVLKEFWPDLERKFKHKHASERK
jgi:hypothetical protein